MSCQCTLNVLSHFPPDKGELIPILQTVQREVGYISEDSVHDIAEYLNISENTVFGVASFYAQFRFTKPATHIIKVCLGTACHVSGGKALADTVQREIGITAGEMTGDGNFEFQEVACLGCCAQAAVVQVDEQIYGQMTPNSLKRKLADYD